MSSSGAVDTSMQHGGPALLKLHPQYASVEAVLKQFFDDLKH